MNDVQAYIDRQLGYYCRFNYDNILRRLCATAEDSFYVMQTNEAIANFVHHPPIFACRFAETSGFEHVLALANEDGKVCFQDTSKSPNVSMLDGFQCHNNAVFDLAWMPKSMNFVTVSGDHTASLWDVQDGVPKQVLVFAGHSKSVKTAVFRPTEPSVFATGARDGNILVWDIRASNQPAMVMKPDNCLMNCHSSFTPKTPGSHSKRQKPDNTRATSITGLVFQSDSTLLSCGECDGNIKVWDLRKNYNLYKREPLPKHSIPYCGSSTKNGYTNLIIDDARIRLYASCMDNVIYCFNISTYNYLPEQRYVGHENGTFYIKTSLSPDSKYLVSGSSDNNAYIWNVKYSHPLVKLVGHWAEVTCAAWSQKGDMKLATCSDDARFKLWRIGKEYLNQDESQQLKGKTEIIPKQDRTNLPQWGALDTPKGLKRKQSTPNSQSVKRTRNLDTSIKKTKRCLADMLNATKENSNTVSKKAKVMELPECTNETLKRKIDEEFTSPKKRRLDEDWSYISPKPGTSFMTPTKNYERKPCIKLTPKKSPALCNPFPVSPCSPKNKVISFTTPTKNLPNFVQSGEAPHLSLMSPRKQKLETTDWLTLMAREKKKDVVLVDKLPLSPKENNSQPVRRNSTTEKTTKSTKSRTLLKYFTVSSKTKEN